MSELEPREFKNKFSDYAGETYLNSVKQLKDPYSSNFKRCIQSLLQILESKAEHDHKDYSVYTGTAGIALLHLHTALKLKEADREFHFSKASDWLKISVKRIRGSTISFLCGDAGPFAIGAVLAHETGNRTSERENIAKLEQMCDGVCNDKSFPDELLYGRCGYLSALLYVQKYCGKDSVNRECIIQVVQAVLKSGKRLSQEQRCSHPLMYEWHNKAYLGGAHGLAGIYFMLLQVQEETIQEEIHQLVRPCIDFMLSLQFASGNCPSSIGSSSGDKLVQWCHGAPGWVPLFALGYEIFKDKRYLTAAKECGQATWKRGLLRKGYGLCHGTAGNAYSFLTLYRLTGEQKYIHYACKFAEWCCDYGKHGCRTPDRPYSMFEGMAGTVYFLTDMLEPSQSAFPTFEFNS